jgi:hypothetical protein
LSSKELNSTLFVRNFLTLFLPVDHQRKNQPKDYKQIFEGLSSEDLKNVKTTEDILKVYLKLFETKFGSNAERFQNFMVMLCVTQKGLTYEEIKIITNISDEEWILLQTGFEPFLINHKSLYMLINLQLKRVIKELHKHQFKNMHEQIAVVLEKNTFNSIRKLEEQTYHLYMSGSFFKLKEIISVI